VKMLQEHFLEKIRHALACQDRICFS